MKIILSFAAGLFGVFLLTGYKEVSAAVGAAVADCLETVVPSLFAFTMLSVWLQKSGLYRSALKPLTFPLSKLLRMDGELCAVFVLANVGGYPVGAKLLSELVKSGRLSEKDAGRMLCCCMASGPGFMLGIVGVKMFGNVGAGAALFGISFAVSLLIAGFVRSRGEIVLKSAESGYSLTSEVFIASITGAAKVMMTVCAVIVGFSAVTAVLRQAGIAAFFESFIGGGSFPALLEITRIKELSPSAYEFPLCAALLSFGGVCVLAQIAAAAGNVPLKPLLISRVPAMLLSALLSLPFSRLFQPVAENIEVSASASAAEPFTKNAVLSLCVLAMCAILLTEDLFERRKGR